MLDYLLAQLLPMTLGAQLVITLVLQKGDICPGQRGRLHKLLPAFIALWIATSTLSLLGLVTAGLLVAFYSKVQTGKTRNTGSFLVLNVAGIAGLGALVHLILKSFTVWGGVSVAISSILLGAAFAQLLLVISRSRLQAFHRILPVVGVTSGMLFALVSLLQAYQLSPEAIEHFTTHILAGFAMLITAILVWCWHIIFAQSPTKVQLGVTICCLIASQYGFQSLI
ncbi:hypothetical protein [Vibrio nigripulchritudo]|uniref:hypothetical protein n=1 Tax=Vibrio nigripulchritudo TaxID=28173 RepID=UPI0024908C02|nr:hypothetical protein [Vibrio nigripulchritudo]BDU36708.1 hypothetical protein TUMSATVNIG2_11770 [Vibrio nigripulchritudo]BDU42418.1 hypothetical protein TUMSATVNIG3_12160 [Vibrio nigripulchritudo]